MEKFLKLLESHEVLFATASSERVCANAKKKRNLIISSQTSKSGGGSETIIGVTMWQHLVNGIVHSFWKQKVDEEAVGPRAIRGSATSIVLFRNWRYY